MPSSVLCGSNVRLDRLRAITKTRIAGEGNRLGERKGQVGAFRHEAGLQASGNGGGLSRNAVIEQGLAVGWHRVLEIRGETGAYCEMQ